ncbi:sugar phosphate isomerase/epimerase family protein [Limnoglobus roseus]|uniref:Sugar phosphate isomerase/epimerase n=1 Tax=Limnoglobus roseus TaxID=2598579 RepID=A0A5C1A7U7_9BACT|nr:sugar phosphate isomerase/epimerase family protein [Limnoglobus roseus]QEL13184.1 sugar phosphate isomerase/epimerase [Limnoglobus roseus]
MILGYNTNGFAHHRLEDALAIIAELGYRGVALTPDVNHADPTADDYPRQAGPFSDACARHTMRSVIETGSRFALDTRRKHQPTLISSDPADQRKRADFLSRHVVLASRGLLHDWGGLGIVSLWSGTATDATTPTTLMVRLADACRRLSDFAADRDVRLAFEPEPGMFIDTMDKFAELHAKVNHPNFGLTLDIGHLVCTGELPIRKYIEAWKHCLWNVHIEDMKAGVHDHLMFGEGEVDFADVFAGLKAIDYKGMVSVELSRHSYDAVNTARRAKAFLDQYVG